MRIKAGLLLLCFMSIAEGAVIDYTHQHGGAYITIVADGLAQTTVCYTDNNEIHTGYDPADFFPDGMSGSITSQGSPCGNNAGGSATANLSTIDQSGYSLSGSASAYLNSGTNLDGFFSFASFARTVSFEVNEAIELQIDMDWTACADCGADNATAWARYGFSGRKSVGGSVYELVFQDAATGGNVSNRYIFEPGTYTIRTDFGANVDSPPGYAANTSGAFRVSVVPIPAAVWLFGSALAGLGWMRRKAAVTSAD